MSWINELIATMCPDGVEFETLGTLVERGTNIRWSEVPDEEFRYIDLTSVDRITHKIDDTAIITSEDAPSRAQQLVREGDVLFGTTRPMLKRYCIVPVGLDGQIASTGYCVLRPNAERLLTNFLFHLLGTADFYTFVEVNERGASYPAIPDSVVKEFRIPVPPIEIQREIVKVLDTFTELEAELEAELVVRRRQYGYFRKELLSIGQRDGVPWTTMGEVTKITIGEFVHKEKQVADGKYPVYNGGTGPTGFYDRFNNSGRKIVVSARGANAGFANRVFEPYWAGNSSYSIDIIDQTLLDWNFVFHLLKEAQDKLIGEQQRGGIPAVSKKQVEEFRIPTPSLAAQKRIVEILDSFDALVNDLSIGLPAELNARRQQYEYYRDKLLTFEERVA